MFDIIIDHFYPLPTDFHDVPLACAQVPSYYSITSDTNRYGYIHHLGQKKGTIWYRRDRQNVCADRVERLDENGNIVRMDYYNRYGFISFSDFYNGSKEAKSRCYYSSDNKPVLNYSYDTGAYCLVQDSRVVLSFEGKDSLISFCMILVHETGKRMISTSVQQLRLLMKNNLLDNQTNILLFESADEYIQYLKEPILHRESQRILLMNNESSKIYATAVSKPTYMIRYVSKKRRALPKELHALTMTASDQVEGLAELAQANPQITFHVAACTKVSPALLAYERYENVKIYPNIPLQKMSELFSSSSFYLDINHFGEVYDAIATAACMPLLIMGFEDTLHNPAYILPEYVFSAGDHQSFTKALHRLSNDPQLYSDHLSSQCEANGQSLEILKSLLSEGENLS
jgi:accessory Sec system glycosyltransferase GtfB